MKQSCDMQISRLYPQVVGDWGLNPEHLDLESGVLPLRYSHHELWESVEAVVIMI